MSLDLFIDFIDLDQTKQTKTLAGGACQGFGRVTYNRDEDVSLPDSILPPVRETVQMAKPEKPRHFNRTDFGNSRISVARDEYGNVHMMTGDDWISMTPWEAAEFAYAILRAAGVEKLEEGK